MKGKGDNYAKEKLVTPQVYDDFIIYDHGIHHDSNDAGSRVEGKWARTFE